MDSTKRRERRRDRHVRRLAQTAIREAGTPTKVGDALGVAPSTACHWTGMRTCPELRDALTLMIRMRQHPDVDWRAVRRAMDEAFDLEDLTAADDETLVARGLYLLEREDELEAAENRAAKTGVRYWDACRDEGWCQIELAQIGVELGYRGIDLLAVHRARSGAAA